MFPFAIFACYSVRAMQVSNKPYVVGMILARGGSKSIPKKSIAPCAGKPLLAYTIEAALHAKGLDRLIISTDDPEMAEVARSFGAEVLFMRPKELAEDTTPDLLVLEHAIQWFEQNKGRRPDIVVHLRPTTPLKAASDITKGIQLMIENPDAQSVRSVCKPAHTPFKMYRLEEGNKFMVPLLQKEYPEVFKKLKEPYNMPRQILPVIWRHSGYVDIMRSEVVTELRSMSGTRILPLQFDTWRDIDIDSLDELQQAERMVQELRKKGKEPWQD